MLCCAFLFSFARRKTLKVRSFPAHQASAELMNPRRPASASGPNITHGPGRAGGKEAASAATPQRAAAHTLRRIMTVEVTGSQGSRATSANPAGDPRRVKSGFACNMDKQTQTCWDIIELLPFSRKMGDEGRMPPDMFVCLFLSRRVN